MAECRIIRAAAIEATPRRHPAVSPGADPRGARSAPPIDDGSPALDAAAVVQARAEGVAEGRREAELAMAARLAAELAAADARIAAERAASAEARERLECGVARLTEVERELARAAEASAIEIAHGVVLDVLGRAAADRALVPELVRAALADLDGTAAVTVRLSPADAAPFLGALGERELPAGVQVIADPSLEPTSCVIANARGAIDASLERQLEAFRRALLDAYGPRPLHGA